jgi:hypothetical protein
MLLLLFLLLLLLLLLAVAAAVVILFHLLPFLVPTAAQNLVSRLHHCVDFIFYVESHPASKA